MSPNTIEKKNLTYWWVPLLFGVLFISIGIWVLRSPAESMETITKIIAVIILVSGTAQVFFTISNRQGIPGWGFQLAGGIIDLVIGIILVVDPSILLKIITIFVSVWLIVNSITLILKAEKARKAKRVYRKWELILGVLLLLLALLLFWHPMILGTTIALWTALAFIILGVCRIVLTIRLRRQSSD